MDSRLMAQLGSFEGGFVDWGEPDEAELKVFQFCSGGLDENAYGVEKNRMKKDLRF